MTTYTHTLYGRSPGNIPADEFQALQGTSDTERQIVLSGGGQQELRFNTTGTTIGVVQQTFPSPTLFYSIAGILTIEQAPVTNPKLILNPRNSSARAGSILLNTSRVIALRDAADAIVNTATGITGGVTSGVAIPLETRVVFQHYMIANSSSAAGAGTGTAFLKLTSVDGLTTYLHVRSTAAHMGTAVITADQLGQLTSATGACTVRFSHLNTTNDSASILDPAVDPPGVDLRAAQVFLGTWTGSNPAVFLSDADVATYLESIASPTSSNPLTLVMPPLGLGPIEFYPHSYFVNGALNQTVQVFKSDGTTKIFEKTYALPAASAEEPVILDSTALAAIPNRSDRYGLQVRIFETSA